MKLWAYLAEDGKEQGWQKRGCLVESSREWAHSVQYLGFAIHFLLNSWCQNEGEATDGISQT